MPVGNPVFFSYACHEVITGNPVALWDTQHAGKEIVTRPMSEYFANDPECHNLLPIPPLPISIFVTAIHPLNCVAQW